MSLAFEKRDLRGIALICLLGGVLVYGVYLLMGQAVYRQQLAEAERASQQWARFFGDNVTDLEAIAGGAKPSPDSYLLMNVARQFGNVFRYKIFSPDGTLRLISDKLNVVNSDASSLAKHNEKAANTIKTSKSFTTVKHSKSADRPEMYTETYLPIIRNGKTIAVVEVYVDQGAEHAAFMENLLIALLAPLLIVALAFGGPATAFYVRTRQKEATDVELAEQNRVLNTIMKNTDQGFCLFDSKQRLVSSNDQFCRIYGMSPNCIAPGMTFREILEVRVKNGVYEGDDPATYINSRLKLGDENKRTHNLQVLHDGRTISLNHKPLSDGGWLATHEDITELQRVQQEAAHLAHYDQITNLPNRTLFQERVEEHTQKEQFAVLCVDLDNFKSVNDTLGHGVGDKLLKAVAERLVETVEERDIVSRLGNDEFAIIQASPRQPEDATQLADRICEAIKKPFELDGYEVNTDVSVGITIAPADGTTANELIRNGDIALNRSRVDGRGKYRFFEAEMDLRMKERRQLEIDLRSALSENEFELYYQPLINTKSEEVCGFEALLRWNHPGRGQVPPDDFIPIAEETGLIVQIGEWVIRQACHTVSLWPENIKIAVNLSTVQFKSDKLVPTVMNALSSNNLSPDRLELEITESIFLEDSENTLQTLLMLRSLGVRIAMDDFGTGYSSLGYLRSFPFDKIKLDRCFINDLGKDDGSKSIIRAVASMGESLNMTTTAEGVETQEQLDWVRSEGYKEVQGYFYSPPRPLSEINERYFPEEDKDGLIEVA